MRRRYRRAGYLLSVNRLPNFARRMTTRSVRSLRTASPANTKYHRRRLDYSYLRIAKRAAMMAGRYAHAKQFKRHRRQLRILRSRLGRSSEQG
jgi:hypothetical protein